MNNYKLGLLAATLACLSMSVEAANFTGVDATPTVYEVTMTKVEFKNSAGSYVVLAEGNATFDIAAATAGAAVGSFASGQALPAGTYTHIRFTLSRTFGLTGSIADAGSGQPCRTGTANGIAGTLNGGAITGVGDGTTDGAAGTKQSVPIPTGAAVTTALTTMGITEVGGVGGSAIQMEVAAPFTLPANATVMPSLRIDFDVANAMEFLTTGAGTCAAMPQPPVITFTAN